MLELRGDEDLAMEAIAVDARSEIWRQNLHDDLATETGVLRDEHPRHAAATKLTLEPVALAETGLKPVPQIGHSRLWRIAERNVRAVLGAYQRGWSLRGMKAMDDGAPRRRSSTWCARRVQKRVSDRRRGHARRS